MIRVVPVTERMWPGWLVSALGVLAMLGVVYGAPKGDPNYIAVGITLAIWSLGPALLHRPGRRLVSFEEALRLIPKNAKNVQARAVRAAHGVSVGVSWKDKREESVLFEVESEGEAVHLLEEIGAKGRDVHVRSRSELLAPLRWLGSIGGIFGGIGYAITVGMLHDGVAKPLFAFTAFSFAIFASILMLLQQIHRPSIRLGELETRSGALGKHLRVHYDAELDMKKTVDVETAPEPRYRVLARGTETTKEWLARVDAVGNVADAYRADVPPREELHAVLTDESAPFDVRLAAGRVLVKKHSEMPEMLARLVEDDIRPYLFDVLDENAADRLEDRGPLFREK